MNSGDDEKLVVISPHAENIVRGDPIVPLKHLHVQLLKVNNLQHVRRWPVDVSEPTPPEGEQ